MYNVGYVQWVNHMSDEWTDNYPARGRGRGIVFERFVCLFVCLFLCQQYYEKTAGPIYMKF